MLSTVHNTMKLAGLLLVYGFCAPSIVPQTEHSVLRTGFVSLFRIKGRKTLFQLGLLQRTISISVSKVTHFPRGFITNLVKI